MTIIEIQLTEAQIAALQPIHDDVVELNKTFGVHVVTVGQLWEPAGGASYFSRARFGVTFGYTADKLVDAMAEFQAAQIAVQP